MSDDNGNINADTNNRDGSGNDPPPPPPPKPSQPWSQAFDNITNADSESINPNTGSLSFSATLFHLKGITTSMDLAVKLSYSHGSNGTFGLPKNWGLDLPIIVGIGSSSQTLVMQSNSFIINPDWADSTGYKSGLQYVTDHGMSLKSTSGQLPFLPSVKYSWILQSVDGSTDYFSDKGYPLGHVDLYGNYLYYTYSAVSGQEGWLASIQDSWQQTIKFNYLPGGKLTITIPDQSTTEIVYSSDESKGVTSYTDFLGNTVDFTLQPFADGSEKGTHVLSAIAYPSGAVSSFVYVGLPFLDANGIQGNLPAVQSHTTCNSQNQVLTRSDFKYGADPGEHTYTGFALKVKMPATGDALMDATTDPIKSYIYDTLKTDLDANGGTLAQTHTYYNHLHLQVEEIQLNAIQGSGLIPVYRTTTFYESSNLATANCYDKPTKTESFHNTAGTGTPVWLSLKQTTSSYNFFGNATSVKEQLWDNQTSGYVQQSSITNTYETTPFQTQILTLSVDLDSMTGITYSTTNTLTPDKKSIETTTLTYVLEAPTVLPWKTRSYQYDQQGRAIKETLAWSPNYAVPQESVSSVTFQKSFSNLQNGQLTITALDALGNPTVIIQDMQKNTGPMITKILPGKQTEKYDYDAAGRMTKHTDALGNATTKVYSIRAGNNYEVTTTPVGYIMRTNYDEIGREVMKLDNGNVHGDPHKPLRTLSANIYDPLSRVLAATDKLGLTTTYTYDNLSRLLSVTDAQKNVVSYSYDDKLLQITQKLNGDMRSVETLNGRMQVVTMDKYPDSGDTSMTYFLRESTYYDGEARITSKSVSMVPKAASPVQLQIESVVYGPESAVLSRTASGAVKGGLDSISRTYTLDLFGNIYTYSKHTVYAATGKQYSHPGPVNLYNANNQLAKAINQEGGVESWTYDANGWLSTNSRLDGTVIDYQYDSVGRLLSTTYPGDSFANTAYDEDGRIVKAISITGGNQETILYSYSLDGTLLQTTYPNSSKQSYELDQFSRTVSSTDTFGITTTTNYTAFGDLAQKSCNGDSITYTYGTMNHTNGKLVSKSIAGKLPYTKSMTYDGFDRISEERIQSQTTPNILDTKYVTDGIGRLLSYISTSEYAGVVETRSYMYDGLNQVVSDTRTTSSGVTNVLFAYDGNSNVIVQETNGQTANMTYNKIDQRTDAGFSYDKNGNLTHDNSGQTYAFDDRDRLVSVTTSNQTKKSFAYHPNEYLANCFDSSGHSSKMYYDGDKINALQTNSTQTQTTNSILRDDSSIVASYMNTGASSYYIARQGSTALLLQPGVSNPTTLSYSAYGVAAGSAPLPSQSSFAFRQEYTEPASQLVYLRARYYNPSIASFISMDTYRDENRYAYCKGDPINLIDSSGRWPSWLKKLAAQAIGFVVGKLVTVAASAVLGPVLGAAIGGAVGGITTGFLSAKFEHKSYSWQQGLIDGLTGAFSGAVAPALGKAAANAFGPAIVSKLPGQGLKYVGKAITKIETKAVNAGISKAVSAAASKAAGSAITATVHAAWSVGSNVKHGDPAGVAQMVASGHKSVLSPQALATMHASQEGPGTHVATHQQQQASSAESYVYQPLTIDGSSGSGSKSVSNAAFDKTFSTAHDWAPSAMNEIVKRTNKVFASQWVDWNAGP